MAFPYRKKFAPQDQSDNYFADDVTGDTWTITTQSVTDGLGHLVKITNNSATDHAGKTVTITGTDADNHVISDTFNLPGPSASVESTKYFKTITSAVPSASIGADTMDIGTSGAIVTNILPLDRNNSGIGFVISVFGTINYTSQYTRTNVQYEPIENFIWNDSDDSALIGATQSISSNYQEVPVAQRIKINSYSSGAYLIYERNRPNVNIP